MTLPIIMLVKDRLELTKQTINTLFATTKLPFNLIILSDNSNSETTQYLKTLDKKAKIIFMPYSTGPGSIKNAGLSIAGDNEFYYITDNDIYFLPNWLETLYKIMEIFPEVGIAGGRTHAYHGELETISKGGISIKTCNQQSGYSMLIRRKVWLDCGPFLHYEMPSGLGKEDTKFCQIATEYGWKIAHPVQPVILHCGARNTFGQNMVGLDTEDQQPFPPGAIRS